MHHQKELPPSCPLPLLKWLKPVWSCCSLASEWHVVTVWGDYCITRPLRSRAEITRHQYRFFHHTILGCLLCIVYHPCLCMLCMCMHVPSSSTTFAQLEMHVDLHLKRFQQCVGYCISLLSGERCLYIWWLLCFLGQLKDYMAPLLSGL